MLLIESSTYRSEEQSLAQSIFSFTFTVITDCQAIPVILVPTHPALNLIALCQVRAIQHRTCLCPDGMPSSQSQYRIPIQFDCESVSRYLMQQPIPKQPGLSLFSPANPCLKVTMALCPLSRPSQVQSNEDCAQDVQGMPTSASRQGLALVDTVELVSSSL
jgi:hypothetical protein